MFQPEMFSQYLRTCYLRNRNKAGKARPVAPAKVNNGKTNNNEALTFPATPPVELGQVLRVMPAVKALVAPAAGQAAQPAKTSSRGQTKKHDTRPPISLKHPQFLVAQNKNIIV